MSVSRIHIVEAVIFRRTGRGEEYLLLKRSDDEPLYPGIWQFLTGTKEESEHALRTVCREMREETGLEPVKVWPFPIVLTFYDRYSDSVHHAPLFAAEVDNGLPVSISSEHAEYRWVAFDEAMKMLPLPGQREALRAVKHELFERRGLPGIEPVDGSSLREEEAS